MRQATVLLVAAAIALMSSADARSLVRSSSREYSADFTKYKVRFNKKYDSPASEGVARHAYEENMQRAAELSKLNPIATYGENVYSDVPRDAFKATHHGGNFSRMATNRKRPVDYTSVAAGSSIDWRQKGAVTPVKNQKNCGGCWSFSTTGNIEGQWFLAGNPLVSLSEEELLACDTTNGGCHGGLMDTAFEWLINTQNGTIVTEASDPFVSANGVVPSCSLQGTVPGAQIYSYHDLPQSESKMAAYLYDHGPISIGVDGSSFQTYLGGIVTNCQYNGVNSLDHAVLIVGFDDTFSTPYWIIKNSWGTIWGEEGYIRVAKGSNQCGLSDAPSTSLVQPAGPTTPAPPSPPTPAPVPTPAGSSSSSGEVPPPPPPQPSPTPAGSSSSSGDVPPPPPPPGGQNFTFYLCQDPLCLNCQTYSLPQGDCVSETFNGDSFAAVCSAGGNTLEVDSFVGTSTCSGKGTTQKVDAGTCYQNVDGQTYVAFACGSGVIHKRT